MTYAAPISFSRFSLSANRVLPKKWSSPESSGSTELRALDAIVASQVHQPAVWLSATLERLSGLADLQPGWDDAEASPIPPSLIRSVRNFITSELVSRLEVEPDIVPTFEGRLFIEWHTESVDLIIEATAGGNQSFYFFNNETGEEVEAPLGQRLDAIGEAFAKLAQRS